MLLYRVRENLHPHPYVLFYMFIFLFLQYLLFRHSFYESPSLQILFTPTEGWIILRKRKPQCWNLFCLPLPFFLCSISLSSVMHTGMCQVCHELLHLGILCFGTNMEYDYLYRAKQNQRPNLIIPFICPFFVFSNKCENQHPHPQNYLICLFFIWPINFFVTDLSAPWKARAFELCIHLQTVEV